MVISVAVVIMAITFVALAAFIIPAIIEIRKTVIAIRETTARTENELKPVLQDLHKTVAELKNFVEGAASKTEDVKCFMEALGDTGRNLRKINNVVGTVVGVLATSSAWVVGAKVAGGFILERLSKTRKEG